MTKPGLLVVYKMKPQRAKRWPASVFCVIRPRMV